jgi:hypothetical protein
MKNLLFAAILALAAAAPMAAPAQAGTIVHKHHVSGLPSGGPDRHDDRGRRHQDRAGRHHHYDRDSSRHNREWRRHHRHHRRHCETRRVSHWRHHHRVFERITVCR